MFYHVDVLPKDAYRVAHSENPDQTAPGSAHLAQTCQSENFGSIMVQVYVI